MTPIEFRRIRKRMGLTQEQLGLALGFRHPQIRVAEFENGMHKISRVKAKQLKKLIGEWNIIDEENIYI